MGQFDDIATKTKRKLEQLPRKVIQEALLRLIDSSPVGDPDNWKYAAPAGYAGGHFRTNWQYAFGTRPYGEIDGTDDPTMRESAKVLDSAGKPGIHYLVNNVPYSLAIENGHSGQAPHGIVGLVAIEMEAIVTTSVRGLA